MEHFVFLYTKALFIAAKAHAGQKDKAGRPYILHPLAVSAGCRSKDAKIAALLHDVLEDTDSTANDLLTAGIPERIVHTVELLTKEKKGYKEKKYFRRIREEETAREVKMADLRHNMDLGRLPFVTGKDIDRYHKYKKEYRYLSA